MRFENAKVFNFEGAFRGMRNPKESWKLSDSLPINANGTWLTDDEKKREYFLQYGVNFNIGEKDLKLAQRLIKAGTEHRKFMRQIFVSVDITAPLYWFKEYDTYKVGTVANSCSTMHKIADKEFTLEDFSCEHLTVESITFGLEPVIDILNKNRELYIQWENAGEEKTNLWWQMIQLLPSSYNQKRTVQLNYQVLKQMYFARKDHKLDEWHILCDWRLTLPYFKEVCVDTNIKEDDERNA